MLLVALLKLKDTVIATPVVQVAHEGGKEYSVATKVGDDICIQSVERHNSKLETDHGEVVMRINDSYAAQYQLLDKSIAMLREQQSQLLQTAVKHGRMRCAAFKDLKGFRS